MVILTFSFHPSVIGQILGSFSLTISVHVPWVVDMNDAEFSDFGERRVRYRLRGTGGELIMLLSSVD